MIFKSRYIYDKDGKKEVTGNSSYRSKTTHKYNISIKDLWYWISSISIEAFKFFQILNYLKNFWKFLNLCKLRVIEYH